MKLKKYLENKNNFFVRILCVIFISTLFCFGVCFAMQTFLNKNASAGSVEEIVNNSIIASQKVLDLENQGITDLESLALLDLSSFSGINLASNGLTNQNMPAIKNLLEAFPNIEMICLYDNNFNFNDIYFSIYKCLQLW